jgi:hypothetical protein
MQRESKPPFKFDIDGIVRRLRKLPISVEGVSIVLPFVEVSVKIDAVEHKVAREVVIRLADRPVLNEWGCCDNCIDEALKSLQEIRQIIVDKQVELSGKTDGQTFLCESHMDLSPFSSVGNCNARAEGSSRNSKIK